MNQEIYDLCSQYADEAVERAREYKKAFMETGGTEEEWEAHDINIHVGYEIKAQTEAYLSFAVQGTENWSSAYSETKYYNIDLKDNKMVTLADVLGHDYAGLRMKAYSARWKIWRRRKASLSGPSQRAGLQESRIKPCFT